VLPSETPSKILVSWKCKENGVEKVFCAAEKVLIFVLHLK
jgi:hypothetical protein